MKARPSNKPHIQKIRGLWYVVRFGKHRKLNKLAEQYTQRMNCRELFEHGEQNE